MNYMKKITMILLFLAMLIGFIVLYITSMKTTSQFNKITFKPEFQFNTHEDKLAKGGCCSHHGGVCGCEGKRQLCCDGMLSPSCICNDGIPI